MIDDIVKTKMTTISSSNSLNLVEVEEREQEEQQLQETSLTPTTVNVEVTEIPTLENYLTANNIIEENDDEHSTKVARVEDIHYSKISAVTGITLSSSELKSHVLTIEILSSPTSTILSVSQDIGTDLDKDNNNNNNNNKSVQDNKIIKSDKSVDSCAIPEVVAQSLPLSDNSVEFVEMVLQKSASPNSTTNNAASTKTENSAFLYYMMTSGQYSSDMDSGTCSDIEIITPPPLPKKMSSKSKAISLSSTLVANADNTNHTDTDNNNHNDDDYNINLKHMMITNSSHNRAVSFTDSESSSSESSLSCDSLSSQEQNTIINDTIVRSPISFLPDSLLKDIRECKLKLANSDSNNKFVNNNDNEYVPQSFLNQLNKVSFNIMKDCDTNNDICYETDKYYKFHLNEHITDDINLKTLSNSSASSITENDESFAGYKDIHSGTSTIRSSKGTIRGVKNRVRNGIATFLQMQCNLSSKNYKERDSGKVVVYTTSMGIVRDTYAKCTSVKQILKTLLIKFEERDVFMSNEYQLEIKERMQANEIKVPQLFVDGYYVGNAAQVERLNETGELRKMLKPFKCLESSFICKTCGGYRLLPCPSCGGSKKSIHRNHFTTEFVALKCMNCDEVGLVKCHSC